MLSLKILALALAMRESGNDPTAANGDCVGTHQIKPIVVDDCNRIVGYKKFEYGDRRDPKKSEEMCILYLKHYLPKRWTIRDAALLWREGPTGRKIFAGTHEKYVADVEHNYERIRTRKVSG